MCIVDIPDIDIARGYCYAVTAGDNDNLTDALRSTIIRRIEKRRGSGLGASHEEIERFVVRALLSAPHGAGLALRIEAAQDARAAA